MPIIYPIPYNVKQPPWFKVCQTLTKRECKLIINEAELLGMKRQTKSRWGEPTAKLSWAALFPNLYPELYELMGKVVVDNNIWNLHLTGFTECINVFKYEKGDFTRPHVDNDLRRPEESKLTVITMLAPPKKGGDLILAETLKVKLKTGDSVVFPSYALHTVTPVLEGVRYVLAGFIAGPRFV